MKTKKNDLIEAIVILETAQSNMRINQTKKVRQIINDYHNLTQKLEEYKFQLLQLQIETENAN